MAFTDINSEDRLVLQTFADHLRDALGWESVYAYCAEALGPAGTLGRGSEREVVLMRDLKAALGRFNPDIPESAREAGSREADPYRLCTLSCAAQPRARRVHPWQRPGRVARRCRRDAACPGAGDRLPYARDNRFLAVRELKIQGVRVPHYNRRADLGCFVNGLPLVFIELKAVYRNIRAGFDDNLTI